MGDKIIGFAVKSVASGIGLVSESIKAKKSKKLSKNSHGIDADTGLSRIASEEDLRGQGDEEAWDLDEAQDEITLQKPQQESATQAADKPKKTRNLVVIVKQFVIKYPLPQAYDATAAAKLAFPVILPQRRPKNRARGFIRAYAPVLAECGISQPIFFHFLETFDQATEASPWINAINLANIAGFFVSPTVSLLITVAVQVGIAVAKEVDGRRRTSTFLDQMNDEFFRPRGLYCLVMTWNPDSSSTHNDIDLTSTISAKFDQSGIQQVTNKFKTSSGNTYGDFTFPETAPLVFPEVDSLAQQSGEDAIRKRNKLKAAKSFTSDYLDRRARARYRAEHPESFLVQGPGEKFSSRYGDPNHPASSGSVFSLLSGGHFNPPPLGHPDARLLFIGPKMGARGGGRFGGRRALEGGRGQMQNTTGSSTRDENAASAFDPGLRTGKGQQGLMTRDGLGGGLGVGPFNALAGGLGGIKKILGKNVLYLMVVNMPSNTEMAAASQMFEKARNESTADR